MHTHWPFHSSVSTRARMFCTLSHKAMRGVKMKNHSTFSSPMSPAEMYEPKCRHCQSHIFTLGPNLKHGRALLGSEKASRGLKCYRTLGKIYVRCYKYKKTECACADGCFLNSQWDGGRPLEGKKPWLLMFRRGHSVHDKQEIILCPLRWSSAKTVSIVCV